MCQKYKNLIRYTITEIIYEELGKTNYKSFNNLCINIGNSITKAIKTNRDEYLILTRIVNELSLIYDENSENITTYLEEFFKNEDWKIDIDFVRTIKKNVKFSSIILKKKK